MDLNQLFQSVTGAIANHNDQNQNQDGNANSGGLLSQIQGLFQQHADATNQPLQTGSNDSSDAQAGILPASQDPLGDPADQGTQAADAQAGILPASQDPLGDPADQQA